MGGGDQQRLTAWVGPWGVSFAANLTPDPGTDIGGWSEERFVGTLRSGKHRGTGRGILPPMPWQSIGKMTDEDLKEIAAYLMSLTSVKNLVPQLLLPAGTWSSGNRRAPASCRGPLSVFRVGRSTPP